MLLFFALFSITLSVQGYLVPENRSLTEVSADIDVMKNMFMSMFSKPRFTFEEKFETRMNIMALFVYFGLDVMEQPFEHNGQKGVNCIGIRPGLDRLNGRKDSIIVIGGHYDTVATTPGVEDNGSGSVAVLELARILSESKVQLKHTIIFVIHDLEETGMHGSKAFVNDYLIPVELIGKRSHFLGAYIIDMNLIYDPTPGSQRIPDDIAKACPKETQDIIDGGSKGDFTVTWMRKGFDDELMDRLTKEWKKTTGGKSKYKLRKFAATNIPETFHRSDHSSFWFHNHTEYKQDLRAMLLIDMSTWRGSMGQCIHSDCDDIRWLTNNNLDFLKTSIDALFGVVVHSPPKPNK